MSNRELDPFTLSDWGLLGGLALIWGSSFVLIEIGLDNFTPAQIAFLRIALGTIALVLVPVARHGVGGAGVDRSAWPRLAWLGLLWMGIPFLLFPLAQQWIDSSLAGMLNGGVPLWAALVATLLARRLPPRGVIVGLVAGFVGIILISLPTLDTEGNIALGAGLIVLATVFYGISLNIAVPLQRQYGSLAVMLRAQAVAAVFTLPFAAGGLGEATFGWSSLMAVAVLGVFGTGIALAMMATLAGRVGAARGSIAIYLVPVVAIVLGVVFRDERVAGVALAGTALVILGAYITSRAQAERTTAAVVPRVGHATKDHVRT
ncbi:DMT family transporter [Euzebya tangerina]|uniref:DMT family transporter n=1 Tax=Euzebya tangerina TaxID=591198 RepID=UPI0013C312D9|nr:DMT family transporter [Euzebya tangerina]